MLTFRRAAVLAALFLAAWLAVLPGAAAGAAVSQPSPLAAGSVLVATDMIRNSQQWVLDMMDVEAAWQLTEGAGVTVAVIDSGVDPDVSDLVGWVTTGPDYTDLHTPSSNPNWGMHGTWMASLIAGHGHGLDGDSGVIGVAPESRILSVRVIPDRSDPHYAQYQREQETRIQQSLAAGIDYAVAHGAKVISMSIGYGAPSKPVRAALERAYSRGVVVVASAGNSGAQADIASDGQAPVSFPADYPGVISVAAVDASGSVAGFSSDNLSVQVAAPGVSVPAQGRDGQYWLVSGTSPACALVAGVAALIKSRYPDLAPNLVASALTSTATDRPSGGYNSQVGFGIVDAAAALAQAGQLSGERPARTGITAAARFGGGSSAIPHEPVPPRGSGSLVLFALLAIVSLALAGVAGARLVVLGRNRQRPAGP
jgi:type VII secretion-associated serine protease mycosin